MANSIWDLPDIPKTKSLIANKVIKLVTVVWVHDLYKHKLGI